MSRGKIVIFKNPNLPTALAIREAFPTPAALAGVALTALRQLRRGCRPSDADLVRLQQLARTSIGIRAVSPLAFQTGGLRRTQDNRYTYNTYCPVLYFSHEV